MSGTTVDVDSVVATEVVVVYSVVTVVVNANGIVVLSGAVVTNCGATVVCAAVTMRLADDNIVVTCVAVVVVLILDAMDSVVTGNSVLVAVVTIGVANEEVEPVPIYQEYLI